jgi:HEAT repeat protein
MNVKVMFPVIVCVAASATLWAQQPAPAPQPPAAHLNAEAAGLMQGWALMAQGQHGLAESHAATVQQKFPHSVAVAVLAIEAGIAASGPGAGLDHYERWLGQRKMEDPSLLRLVALGVLKAEARQESPARSEALRLLNGEPGIDADAVFAGAAGAEVHPRVMAALGSDAAVSQVIDELKAGATSKVAAIEALGASGSPRAEAAVAAQLADPRPEVRGAAADALARLQARDSQARLRELLKDEFSFVRTRAAAALLALNDPAGLPLLRELLVSETPASQLIGAEALAATPDATWLETVRGLARSGEPTVRLGAAQLLGPHDPELARSVSESLAQDDNPAVRTLASRTLAQTVSRDLATLRRLLRSDDPLTRVRASGNILAATR